MADTPKRCKMAVLFRFWGSETTSGRQCLWLVSATKNDFGEEERLSKRRGWFSMALDGVGVVGLLFLLTFLLFYEHSFN